MCLQSLLVFCKIHLKEQWCQGAAATRHHSHSCTGLGSWKNLIRIQKRLMQQSRGVEVQLRTAERIATGG